MKDTTKALLTLAILGGGAYVATRKKKASSSSSSERTDSGWSTTPRRPKVPKPQDFPDIGRPPGPVDAEPPPVGPPPLPPPAILPAFVYPLGTPLGASMFVTSSTGIRISDDCKTIAVGPAWWDAVGDMVEELVGKGHLNADAILERVYGTWVPKLDLSKCPGPRQLRSEVLRRIQDYLKTIE